MKKGDELIIFLHGLFCDSRQPLLHAASEYFTSKGYECYRYNIPQITNQIAIKDFNQFLSISSQTYSKIIVISHSLGAFIALPSKQSFIDNFVFWEPSLHPQKVFQSLNLNKDPNSLAQLPNIETLLKNIQKPSKIIGAQNAGGEISKQYYKIMNPLQKSLSLIKNADHNFSDKAIQKKLFSTTLRWLKSLSQ